MRRIAVVGGGAWGTALAHTLARAGRAITLWVREEEVRRAIVETRENRLFLPGVALDPGVAATSELAAAAAGAEALLLVVPAQHLRRVAAALAPLVPAGLPVLLCAKGIEEGSLLLMTEVAAAVLPQARRAVLSGPTFAIEVARGLPTAVTIAAEEAACGAALVEAIGTRSFRPYLSDDPIGAEIGGAVKNI